MLRVRGGDHPLPPVFCMCGREGSYELGVLYVWQGKDLGTAKNWVLVRFSDVWQGLDLVDFGCYSR
jgi:hypothetical protein